eukprot:TRINITY_DN595_c0_g1_i1.p1 TRINITY_DN595_c0_g1~~TRINITY_DN595_c0_g1_i1.p1  ORF type:complete len:222 (+),score=28.39 TRINITY_DN595_c0_g1_i1:89-754(+)
MSSSSEVVDSVQPKGTKTRLFGRTQSVHALLGGGKVADVILWKQLKLSVGILGTVTFIWLLFEKSGYTLLTLVSNTLLVLVSAIFVWAQTAYVLNRSPPPVPELKLSEETVQKFATILRVEVNRALASAHSIALGRDYKKFASVIAMLWALSYIGSWFNFLTLIFFGVVLVFTVPFFYDKNEDRVDALVQKALDEAHKLWALGEEKVKGMLNKLPHEKKVQ